MTVDTSDLEAYIRPEWLTDAWMANNSYVMLKFLKRGGWAGNWACLGGMLFSWRLFVGLDETGYAACYDFPDKTSAVDALDRWGGEGHPPGPWLKFKGRLGAGQHVEIEGPGLTGSPPQVS